MRHYVFISLLVAAFALDLAFLALGLAQPGARLFQAPAALAAPQPQQTIVARPSPTRPPTATPSPTATAAPSPTATPSPSATATPSPTPVPQPRVLAARSVSFTPSDRAVRANIRLALAHYSGALAHVVLGPGEVFSFNAALGLHPQGLPWKNVRVKPTAAPTDEPATGDAQDMLIQGGGLCDLASRYVMAARPLLPARAFRFVNHVRSNGIHLAGVPERDSVSIWAIGGGKGEHDLKVANTTAGWIEWVVERQGEKITVTARLWDHPPPG